MKRGLGALRYCVGAAVVVASAAAPGGRSCGEAREEGLPPRTESDIRVRPLVAEWLIPPEPRIVPPLAAPAGLAVDERSGRILVLETQPAELRVYDLRDGRLVRVLGREGDGPGEYRYPMSLAANRAGLTGVLSMGGRVTFWGAQGRLRGVVRTEMGIATDLMAARADTFYVKVDLFPPADRAEIRAVTPDTVLAPRYADTGLPGTVQPGRPFRNHAYAVTAGPSGDVWVAPPGPRYAIFRFGPDGVRRLAIRRPEIGPLRRTNQEVRRIRDRVRQGFAAAGRSVPSRFSVPVHRPHVARLAVGPDGTLWALTQRGDSAAAVIDRFETDGGALIGSYRLPLRVTHIAAGHDAIYVLARGHLNVAGLAVARLDHDVPRGVDGI